MKWIVYEYEWQFIIHRAGLVGSAGPRPAPSTDTASTNNTGQALLSAAHPSAHYNNIFKDERGFILDTHEL